MDRKTNGLGPEDLLAAKYGLSNYWADLGFLGLGEDPLLQKFVRVIKFARLAV